MTFRAFADAGIDIHGSHGGEVRTICPQCSLHRRKSMVRCLSVNVSAGAWLCHHCGWAGGLGSGRESVDAEAIERLRSAAEQERVARYAANRPKVTALWKAGSPIAAGDPASRYLAQRGIILDLFPADLRYIVRLPYFDVDGHHVDDYPAMLAAVRNSAGDIVAVHRTHLRPDGTKAPCDPVKKLSVACGPVSAAAIRLGPVRDSTLGVAEGIETALAASLGAKVPTWAAVSASGMRTFQWPQGLRRLIVFGDNDANETGQRAAADLAERARRCGLSVNVLIPDQVGADWADVWLTEQQVSP